MVESKFKWSSSSTADDAALVKSVASTIRRDMLALMSGFSACDRAAPTQFGRLARGARLYMYYSTQLKLHVRMTESETKAVTKKPAFLP